MKIERGEVERIAHNAKMATGGGMDMWLPPEVIAELCRLALEVMDAPVAYVPAGRAMADLIPASLTGQRVRLVRVGEE